MLVTIGYLWLSHTISVWQDHRLLVGWLVTLGR
jgi:hypothetical protein